MNLYRLLGFMRLKKIDGKRTQQIDIYYNVVGIINIPTPEELAAMIVERIAQKEKEHISA